MQKPLHIIYITTMILVVVAATVYLMLTGLSYYETPLEERFYHVDYDAFKPSGTIGHGLGIFGSLLMFIGVSTYMLRKRIRSFSKIGLLKHWLEFHIFLCTLGPILVLYHTTFKFGGIVAISFWSMVAVFLSGVIGRFIYIQIPRSIEGRELSLTEIRSSKNDLGIILKQNYNLAEESYIAIIESTKFRNDNGHKNIIISFFRKYFDDRNTLAKIKSELKKNSLTSTDIKTITSFVKEEISMNRKIDRLTTMQNLFKYWHVAHLPFAIIMLIIMIIHVIVTIVFGYKWIF